MLQKISSVFVMYRRKTLTGSPDPTHANGTDKPCTHANESATSFKVIFANRWILPVTHTIIRRNTLFLTEQVEMLIFVSAFTNPWGHLFPC